MAAIGDFVGGDELDGDDGNRDAVSGDRGEEAGIIFGQGSPVEADVGGVESEDDIGEVVDFFPNQSAVEGDVGVGGLNLAGVGFFDGTTEAAEERGGEEAAFVIGDDFFGETDAVEAIVIESPALAWAIEGVVSDEERLGMRAAVDAIVRRDGLVLHREALEGSSFFRTVGAEEDEVAIAESGGIDIAQKREDEADAVAFGWGGEVACHESGAGGRGGPQFIGEEEGWAEEPEENEGEIGGGWMVHGY